MFPRLLGPVDPIHDGATLHNVDPLDLGPVMKADSSNLHVRGLVEVPPSSEDDVHIVLLTAFDGVGLYQLSTLFNRLRGHIL